VVALKYINLRLKLFECSRIEYRFTSEFIEMVFKFITCVFAFVVIFGQTNNEICVEAKTYSLQMFHTGVEMGGARETIGILHGQDGLKDASRTKLYGHPSFCDNPFTLDFDFKSTDSKFKGYYNLANDKSDMRFLKKMLTGHGDALNYQDQPRIRLNVGPDGTEHTLSGFGGKSGTVVCNPKNTKEGKPMCLTKSGVEEFNFTPYITHTDNKSYAVIVRCYQYGNQGWTIFSINGYPLTRADKEVLLKHVHGLGFEPKNAFFDHFDN